MKSHPGTTDKPHAAALAQVPAAMGAPKGAARKGVPSALRPGTHPGDGRHPIAWLHITAPGRGTVPTATSRCACGRDGSAVGKARVLALVEDHQAHRDVCPLRTSQEGRNAA
ncbi:hypothetical protein ACIQMR_18345 [Streptomyces sp. NPDC091376]|uniref:hypothetical protein n=1 Tax=Streptomyces sp. NPDC091376 TaxID=3365994 RepID=UPI0037F7A288